MKDLTKCVLITATLFVLYSCMDKNGLNGAPEPTPNRLPNRKNLP